MAKHLQIGIQVNTDKDPEPEVNVTPVDSAIPDVAGSAIETGILLADLNDAQPGSGKYEADAKLNLPIKVFGRTFYVNYPVRITVSVVDK